MKTIEFHVVSKDESALLTEQVCSLALDELRSKENIDVKIINHLNNSVGLCKLYNSILEEKRKTVDCIVFMHGDVMFDIVQVVKHYFSVSDKYDLVGFAGAKKIDLKYNPFTWFTGSKVCPNGRYGRIIHTQHPFVGESFFNEHDPETKDTRVAFIDGLAMFLGKRILDSDLKFDEQFTFDFYDSDFCMQCNMAKEKFKVGVIIEPTVHQSVGMSVLYDDFQNPEKLWRQKWGLV